MSLSAKLKITVKNPLYPASGESSTEVVEKTLNYDPLFKHLSKVPVNFDVPGEGVKTYTCEVRDKSWEVDTEASPEATTVAVYSVTPFGVEQSDGEVYE